MDDTMNDILEDTKLVVKLNNQDTVIDVIDIIENNDNGKRYMLYTIDGDEEDVFMSLLEEDENSFTLLDIEDPQEAKYIEDYLEHILTKEVDNNE